MKSPIVDYAKKIEIEEYQDHYINTKLASLKSCKTIAEIKAVINKIYEDGFEDGANAPKDN